MLKTPVVFPPHPAVDWAGHQFINGVDTVAVTCPVCGAAHGYSVKSILHRIRYTKFTGRCDDCGVKQRAKHTPGAIEVQHD